MTISERLEILLDDLQGIQLGKPPETAPEGTPKFCVFAKQIVQGSLPGNSSTIDHQAVGASIVDCLTTLQAQVDGAKGMKRKEFSPILTRGGSRE